MSEAPLPMTPPDCDLTDFSFMPLEVRRLRDSDLAALESPEACWAAVLLWCASWHQVPAASLPDDDRVLSNLAGYGRVIKEWLRIKDGALRGWVKCSDGRLYHPMVAEKARESWKSKVKYAYERLADRTRKAAGKRDKEGLPPIEILTLDEWISRGRPDSFPESSTSIPPKSNEHSAGKSNNSAGKEIPESGIPAENALKGQGQGQGQGYIKEIKDKEEPAAAPPPYARTHACEADDDLPPPHAPFETQKQPELSAETVYAKLIRQWEKERGKASTASGSNPKLMTWAKKGVTEAQLREAYDMAVTERDLAQDPSPINAGFIDVFLAKVLNPPGGDSALNRQPSGAATSKHWASTWSGIVAKGVELGIEQESDELPPMFKARVFAAANLSDHEKSVLRADYGVSI